SIVPRSFEPVPSFSAPRPRDPIRFEQVPPTPVPWERLSFQPSILTRIVGTLPGRVRTSKADRLPSPTPPPPIANGARSRLPPAPVTPGSGQTTVAPDLSTGR